MKITIVPAGRPDSNSEAVAFVYQIAKRLGEIRGGDFLRSEFVECDSCAAKPGSPELCAGCLANRHVIGLLTRQK